MKVLYVIIGIICMFAINCSLLSCSQNSESNNHKVVQNGNKTIVHSFEVDSLKELINLQFLKPNKVEFEYVVYDNSGKNDRIQLAGPSDYYLQAVLHFDSIGINQVIRARNSMSIRRPQYDQSDFFFSWLNKEDRNELNMIGDSIKGSPAIMFASAHLNHGGYIITKSKVFLKISNN